MYYTQKRIGVIFFLLCLLIYVGHNIISQKIISIAKNYEIYKHDVCFQSKHDFFYNPPMEIILQKISTFSKPENRLYTNNQEQKYYYTEIQNQKYLVYFVQDRHKDQIYTYTTDECSDSKGFFFLSSLEKNISPTNLYFINENRNYIRRDSSYICNKELQEKHPDFHCHPDSYYIDLSEFV